MNPDNSKPDIDLFHEVLEQPDDLRDAFIERRHAADPERVKRFRGLLKGHRLAEQVASDTTRIANANAAAVADPIPERIGPYRVLDLIGEGGMGVVYAAEQASPIRRRVAIKVIKLGMDTKEVIARFDAERQAVAMLDHPGIAKVFDAASTTTGRPYFVMELVRGLPLTEYCERHKLTLRERLRLFIEVCDAVRHAHQRGIIHRDLKPSNVLVTAPEGKPIPKVIDFGVAKATASRLSEQTVFTEQGKLIGTPEYMSPEQAEMSGLGVDTRTDVYSLGVILYELITGVLPFDSRTLRSGGYAEIQRIIREVDPPRPSVRLSELPRVSSPSDAEADRPGDVHPGDPIASSRRLRGELDWIVMRAIEKDRTRRYESASALFEDIERYLSDLPVLAGPPSAVYTLRKFVKRHRYVTLAAISVIVAVSAGVAGLTTGLIDAHRARALADQRADNALVAADFLQTLLFQVDPEFGGGDRSLREVIDIASRSVGRDLGGHPEVEASVRESIGVAYRRLSMFPEAEPHLRISLKIRREYLGDQSLQTARSFIAMANLLYESEGKVTEALADLAIARQAIDASGLAGSPAEGWLLLDIGIVSLAGDHLTGAHHAFTESERLIAAHKSVDHPDVSRPLRGLAMVALGMGDLPEAERLARQAVRLCAGEGTEYIGARAKLVLARVLMATGQFGEANSLLADAGTQFARTVSPRHVRTAELDACLSELRLLQGQPEDALRFAHRCAAVRREILATDHWGQVEAALLIERARIALGAADQAESELLELSEEADRLVGEDHPLAIAIASARLECARALEDDTLLGTRTNRLDRLLARRVARLRAEMTGASD